MRENQNTTKSRVQCWKVTTSLRTYIYMLLLVFAGSNLFAQQKTGTHVSSYNFSQSSGTYVPVSGGTAFQISTTGTQGPTFNLFTVALPFTFNYNGTTYSPSNGSIYILAGGTAGYIHISTTAPGVLSATPLTSTNVAFNMANGGVISAFTGASVGNGTSDVTNTGTSTTFIRVVTSGTTPNRTATIQFENFRRAAATADSWNWQIVLNENGGAKSNQIDYIYGSMAFGVATATTRQVGMRGFATPSASAGVPNDVQYRVSTSTTVAWTTNTLGTTDGVNSPAGTAVALSSSNFPASGTTYNYSPCTVAPSYATIPFTEDFETSPWANSGCGSGITQDIPSNFWRSGPLIGNMSWRRQDAGATARWSSTAFGTPPAPPSGTGYAKFHVYGGSNNAGMKGMLDLHVNASSGLNEVRFDYVNADGTDALEVYQSTNGGSTFTLLASYGVNAAWSTKIITLPANSATCVIRFIATSDYGLTDIGIDNVIVQPSTAVPNCATLVSPADGSSGSCPVINWANGGGATSYDVYFGTTTPPPFVQNQTGTNYVPPGGYVNGQLYYWQIVPQNANGPAVGCSIYSYTAGQLAQCYCTPTSTNGGTGGDGITAISFATLNQTANTPVGPPGYKDDTGITISVNQGSTYAATFTEQDASDAIKVWIDFNNNGSFEDAGEMVLQTAAGTTVLGNISIPLTASLGNHRLRIRNAYTPNNAIASVTSCSTVTYGETRDYTLNIGSAVNDASVTNVYSMGSLPKGYGDPHAVRARVYNGGAFTMTSFNVTMNITGANTFSDVQTIASLAPGASTIVTFAGFNPANTGINTITVSVPNDDVNSNNSASWDQDVTANIYSYKNPLQSNFGGVGFNSATGDFVGKFAASSNFGNSDTINEVQVEFTTTGQSYQIGIWAADGVGGIPGTLLYTSPTYTTATGGPQIKAIPNIVVSGDFYVGARQTGTTNIGFAYQAEIPVRNQTFYFTSPSGAGAWQDFSQPANPAANPFRFSIQVRFEVPQIPLCPVGMLPANAATSCQNGTTLSWNTGGGGTTSYDVYFSTVQSDVDNQLAGALVSNNQAGTSYNTGVLTPGQTYYWRVVGVNNYGESSGCSTQSFTTNLYSCYCAVASASGTFEHIGNVSYGAFSNTSSSSTYTSYTNLAAVGPVAKGAPFNLSVTVNNAYSTDVIYVYIDLNGDGDFGDANELAGSYTFTTGSGATPQTVLVPVNVDASALTGETGMRIKMGDGDPLSTAPVNTDPCQTAFSFGEVEDYRISIDCGVVTAASNGPLCSGNDLNLTSVFTGVGSPTGYTWSGPNSFSSTQQNPTINGATSAASGTYTITVTATGGCVATSTFTVVVNQSPDLSTSGGGSACAGGGITLSVSNNAPGQGSGNTYLWSTDAVTPFTSTQQTPNVTGSSTVNNSGVYTVVVTNSFLCTASATETVAVNPNPTLSVVSTQNVGCVGGSDGIITVSASNGAPSYDYSTDNFATQNNSGVMTNLPTGNTTIEVQDANGCTGSITQSLTAISSTPTTAAVVVPFTGMPTNVCAGTTATLSIAPVPNATMYIWDAPTTAYFNGVPTNVSPFTTSTPSVTITYGAPSGSLYSTGVQAANGCGASLRKVQKTRGTVSVPTGISGALTACANTGGNYSISAVEAASSYLWTITGDATVSGTGATAAVTFGPSWTGGTLCVAAQTTCYTSPTKCISISNTATSLSNLTGATTACPNTVLSYSVTASAGAASYSWTLPAGASGSSTTNSISVSYGPGYNAVGSICVSVTSICGVTSPLKCKTVAPGLPSQPSSITGALTGLCSQNQVYSCPSQGIGTTYNWTAPAGTNIIGNGSTSITAQFGAFSTGNVCVTANNSCGTSTARCVPVKGAPNAPGAITANPSSWCANTPGIEFTANTAALTGSYSLSWNFPPSTPVASYALGGGNSNSLTLDWISGTANVNVTAGNACGTATKTSTWSSTCRQGEVGAISSMTVSPNPTTGEINVNYTAQKGNTVINVLDLAGRVVMTQTATSVDGANNTQLDMSKLAKGAYMLSVQSTQGNKQVRVVVE